MDIEKRVIFVPSVEDNVKALSAVDVFVMPSLQEGLGLSLMEAMACGIPVVGSDVGGIRNLIRDGDNGRLVKPKDVDGLAKAITDLLEDASYADSLGRRGRDFIHSNFSIEKMTEGTERVYKIVISPKP